MEVEPSKHFVYMYKDAKGACLYVGYGATLSRPESHVAGSHCKELSDYISKAEDKYFVQVAGPFGQESVARAVETALISALAPKFNTALGHRQHRFRPYGIPPQFADRLSEPPMVAERFLSVQGTERTGVLFVSIAEGDFSDGRAAYDPTNPPTDLEVLARIDRWWQLEGRYLPSWVANPNNSPGLLVGV